MRAGAAAQRRGREEQRKLQADDDKKNKKGTKGSKPSKAKATVGSTPVKESAKRAVRTCPHKNLAHSMEARVAQPRWVRGERNQPRDAYQLTDAQETRGVRHQQAEPSPVDHVRIYELLKERAGDVAG